ncbi:hypothetical protein SAMN04487968_108178 [Nocardioides terrae]|uniref:Uncharacterized protein n=1 Tax=Nocardioides terrae TaxID=574651 RepID=A0A1I1KIZ6_9ACTN|nr:hypothetical protein [Nocardioides terrae]SFC60777.1 hypothetical protein SAMN04487968_108178 [Nocardioides terrae]
MTEQTIQPTLLHSQADVEKFWTTICQPQGWRTPELWVVLVDAEGEPFPSVHHVPELPESPDRTTIDHLVHGCRRLLDELDAGGRVAMLLCRPGASAVTPFDKAWTRALVHGAHRVGVELEVVHVASDATIRPLPLDEVA